MTDLNNLYDARSAINYAVISTSGADNTIVSAVSGLKIAVCQLALFADSEVSVRFESGTGGTALTGVMPLFAKQGDALDPGAATGSIILPFSPVAWFETAIGALLNLEITGSGDVFGVLGYFTD